MNEYMNKWMNKYMNMPLNDLASFTFYTYKDFYLAAEENQWIAYEITILGFFFFLLQLLWTQTEYFSGLRCSVDTVLRLKGHIM